MKLLIWAEHTTLAGKRCYDDSKADSDDVVTYEGCSPAELAEIATAYERRNTMWHHRAAAVLRDAAHEIVE